MSNNQLSKYSAKIKDVYIELKDYRFFHSPYHNPEKSDNSGKKKKSKDSNHTKDRFIGRNKVKERIISILEHTDIKSGSYLITGFRGMGKTSVIRQAIDDYNAKSCRKPYLSDPVDPVSKFLKIARIAVIYFVTGFLISVFYSADSGWNPLNWGWNPLSWEWNLLNWTWTLPRAALLTLGVIHAIHTFSVHRKGHVDYLFLVPWNVFRIVLVVSTVLLSVIFFLNYQLLCEIGAVCLNGEVANRGAVLMETFFPVNYTENVIFSTVFRIVIGLVFSYLLLSAFLFSFDLLSLVGKELVSLRKETLPSWLRFGSNKKKTKQIPENRGYVSFEIYLSQDSLDEMDVLRRMAMAIEDYWLKEKYEFDSTLFDRKIYLPWNFLVTRINRPREESTGPSYKSVLTKLSGLRIRMSGQVTTRKEMKFSPNFKTDIAGGLAELSMPMGTYSNNDEIVFPVANAKEAEYELKEILNDIDELRNKQDSKIPQFVFIIDELDKIEPNNAHINTETDAPVKDLNVFDPDTNRFRQRREAVAQLLANLKGFLSVVKAKVFFIGGREMFDADLADISDRESFYSSIFNDVIYVESFFKDTSDESGRGKGGITQMTEAYVCRIILNDLIGRENNGKKPNLREFFDLLESNGKHLLFRKPKEETPTKTERIKFRLKRLLIWVGRKVNRILFKKQKDKKPNKNIFEKLLVWIYRKMYRSLSGKPMPGVKNDEPLKPDSDEASGQYDEIKKQKYKVIFTLQNFIIFLTYRSNGTPKKLTGLTEQLIVRGPLLGKNKKDKENFFQENIVVLHEPEEDSGEEDLYKKLFLKFSFNTQYEIGLTSNLYRPYLIANSRHLKALGDKLLFSSSFIIDHILKFHPFGFSWRNLELIPEVVLVNREPNLREFIEDLMRFYSLNYIRDTVSGIFDYRFRSIIRRELIHLSKTSDLSSAAFNFTLDESLSTKQHYKGKLVELQAKYKGYTPIAGDNMFVHSLCFVQTILGDLHFYDKEYDEAILYYTESIQTLRLPDAVALRQITRHQFLLWLRNKLKLGLTLEKMRAFDSAFSLYKTLTLDTDRYFDKIVGKEEKSDPGSTQRGRVVGNLPDASLREAEDHRTIQIVTMPFVALLAVTEKARNDGITYTNLATNREDFLRTINALQKGSETDFDPYRKNFLQADYYNNVGSLLYYKNCQFSNVFSTEAKDKCFWLDAFEVVSENPLIEVQEKLYKDGNQKPETSGYFPSLTSFNYYWNSLYFLLEYHKKRIVEQIKIVANDESPIWKESNEVKLGDNLLALTAGYLLPGCNDMVSSSRLYYIANVISKIGDSILASLTKDNIKLSEDEFDALDIINSIDICFPEEGQPSDDWNNRSHNRTQLILKNIIRLSDLVNNNLFNVQTVLYLYKLAAVLYQKAGYNAYFASHLTRILYVVKDVIELNKEKDKTELNKEINDKFGGLYSFWGIVEPPPSADEDSAGEPLSSADEDSPNDQMYGKIQNIAEKVFQATTWNNEVSNRPQILKYKEIFGLSDDEWDIDRNLIYNNLNNIPDIKEVMILVEGIKMKLGKKDDFINKFTLGKSITSAYGSINNRYQRMLELKYRMERCYFIMNTVLKLGFLFEPYEAISDASEGRTERLKEWYESMKDEQKKRKILEDIGEIISYSGGGRKLTIKAVFEFLIQEALFCARQLINMIRLYNPGYVIGYSFIAAAHSRMGDWCQVYENYLKLTEERNFKKRPPTSPFKNDILKMLGTETLLYLEPKNHYETALLFYHKMVQIHSDGKSYKDKLHDIYMLEDDYNDSAAHYTIASERLRINTGDTEIKIAKLNAKIDDSMLYQYTSYFSKEDQESPGKIKKPRQSESGVEPSFAEIKDKFSKFLIDDVPESSPVDKKETKKKDTR